MWNLKNKTNEYTEQNRNRLIDTENKWVIARGEASGWMGKIGEGNQEVQTCNYRISKSQGYAIQHKECS